MRSRQGLIGSAALLLILLLLMGAPVSAQTATLAYGELTSGEVTDADAGLSFTFEAAAGDVAVIQLQPGETNGASADVRVLDSASAVVADSGAMMVFGRSGQVIAAELRRAETYTINVYGDTGTFNLLMLRADPLAPDTPLTGTATPPADRYQPGYSAAYVAVSDTDFSVDLTLTGGAYIPSLVAYRVDQGGNLFPVASVFRLDSADVVSNWRGGGIQMAGSRDLNIFLVGDLEVQFGSTDDSALAPAQFTIALDPQDS